MSDVTRRTSVVWRGRSGPVSLLSLTTRYHPWVDRVIPIGAEDGRHGHAKGPSSLRAASIMTAIQGISDEPPVWSMMTTMRGFSREEANKLRQEIDPLAVNGMAAKWATTAGGSRVRPVIGDDHETT